MSSKNFVLKVLENNKGNIISGEDLANKLNISRNAIWKAITSLRKEGYIINAIPNKGYCLLEQNDFISEVGIRKYLNNNYPGDIYAYKTIDSTNIKAKKLAIDSAKNFTIVVSEEQTNGKGRLGRSFYSPNNTGIYMSVIIKPDLSLGDAVLITTAASVCICRAIKKVSNIDTKIKWVNDVILNNKKVCGILTEAVTNFESGSIEAIILGIGINFTKPENDFPDEIKEIATALFNANINNITRNQLIAEIVNELMLMLPTIKNRDFIEEYRSRSIVLNKNITYYLNNKSYFGEVVDINNDGALIVKNEEGTLTTLSSGEITIRTI